MASDFDTNILSVISLLKLSNKKQLISNAKRDIRPAEKAKIPPLIDDYVIRNQIEIRTSFNLHPFLVWEKSDVKNLSEGKHQNAEVLRRLEKWSQNKTLWKYPPNRLIPDGILNTQNSAAALTFSQLGIMDGWSSPESDNSDLLSQIKIRKLEWQESLHSALNSVFSKTLNRLYYLPIDDSRVGYKTWAIFCSADDDKFLEATRVQQDMITKSEAGNLSQIPCCLLINAGFPLIRRLVQLGQRPQTIKSDVNSKRERIVVENTSSRGELERWDQGETVFLHGETAMRVVTDCLAETVLAHKSLSFFNEMPILLGNKEFLHAVPTAPHIRSYSLPRAAVVTEAAETQTSEERTENETEYERGLKDSETKKPSVSASNIDEYVLQLSGWISSSCLLALCDVIRAIREEQSALLSTASDSLSTSQSAQAATSSPKYDLLQRLFKEPLLVPEEELAVPPSVSHLSGRSNPNPPTGQTSVMTSFILKNPFLMTKTVVATGDAPLYTVSQGNQVNLISSSSSNDSSEAQQDQSDAGTIPANYTNNGISTNSKKRALNQSWFTVKLPASDRMAQMSLMQQRYELVSSSITNTISVTLRIENDANNVLHSNNNTERSHQEGIRESPVSIDGGVVVESVSWEEESTANKRIKSSTQNKSSRLIDTEYKIVRKMFPRMMVSDYKTDQISSRENTDKNSGVTLEALKDYDRFAS